MAELKLRSAPDEKMDATRRGEIFLGHPVKNLTSRVDKGSNSIVMGAEAGPYRITFREEKSPDKTWESVTEAKAIISWQSRGILGGKGLGGAEYIIRDKSSTKGSFRELCEIYVNLSDAKSLTKNEITKTAELSEDINILFLSERVQGVFRMLKEPNKELIELGEPKRPRKTVPQLLLEKKHLK